MKAIRTDRELECPGIDAGLRARGVELVTLPEGVAETELAAAVADADLLLMCYTAVTGGVIRAAQRLRGIIKYGVGIDAIDMEVAIERGVPVANVPDYAEETVAEAAFGLMLMLLRKFGELHLHMQETGWGWPVGQWLGADISGKTLGLIGTGRIGRKLARMAGAGFGMRILGYDPQVDAASMSKSGIEKRETLEELLREADVVSLHAVLNAETRHMIGAGELRQMKRTAVLINVSRGALVDEAALVKAIKAGEIAGAGLDVYSEEPLRTNGHPLSPLFGLPNVILLPHLAFYTREAMERLENDTLARCDELLSGQPLTVKSRDPRLRRQTRGVKFED